MLIVLLLAITTSARLRMYFLVRKAQIVLHALATIQIDQTTESQVNRLLPNMERREWEYKDGRGRIYYAKLTNENDRTMAFFGRFVALAPTSIREAYAQLVVWLGYKYFDFDVWVAVEQGKVTGLAYGLANRYSAPRYAGQVGYAVSARSFHGFWQERLYDFRVLSTADVSPEYRPTTSGEQLSILYAADTPRAISDRLFQLDMNCFWWGIRGCESGQQIAPQIWQEAQNKRQQTHEQLISEECPDSIVAGRMKYLPEVAVALLELTGSGQTGLQEQVNKAGGVQRYKFVKMLRDPSGGRLTAFRLPPPEPLVDGLANQVRPAMKMGAQVLYFGYPKFDSCRFIPATPSALEIVRRAPIPPKRWGDQVVEGLL